MVSNNLKILYCEATDFFTTSETASFSISILSFRVAEVVRRHEGPSLKSLDLDENFSISPTVGGCELGGLRSSSPSQGQVHRGAAEVDLDVTSEL